MFSSAYEVARGEFELHAECDELKKGKTYQLIVLLGALMLLLLLLGDHTPSLLKSEVVCVPFELVYKGPFRVNRKNGMVGKYFSDFVILPDLEINTCLWICCKLLELVY